ncbi:MAG TPA: hypothetical protein VIM64_09550 [Puia sp.]
MARPRKDSEMDQDYTAVADNTQEVKKGYLAFDKWQMDVQSMGDKRYKLTCVTKKNSPKLSQHEADMLNAQSHNSRVRYYLQGEVTNGHEEIISVN